MDRVTPDPQSPSDESLSGAEHITPSLPRSHSPPPIPDHELLRLIGVGSYGEVWLARTATGSFRAVKIVYRVTFDHGRPFEREFEGIKKFEPISHARESQVDIFHVGRNDEAGFFYYIMELADAAQPRAAPSGTSLNTDKLITDYFPRTLKHDFRTRGPLPVAECVQVALSLTRALEHLHAHGLVHRDIKPSNIIYVNGLPKLADIGLVTSVDATRSFVGTDGYIPPEGPGTPPADLYSLGKVFYECVTGKDRIDFPELPADWRTRPDFEQLLEFNEVLTKACDADPGHRYNSAAALRADIELLQTGRSVKQRRTAQKWLTWIKRAMIAGSVAGLLIIGLLAIRGRNEPLDPLTTGKNLGGYPPTTMRGTRNLEAWNHYRVGWSLKHVNQAPAEQEFEKAIQLDPRFALGYGELFMSRFGDPRLLTHAKAPHEFRALAAKMVELDHGLAETRHVLGFIRFWEWNWADAEHEYREALRLNPDCIPAYISYGFYLSHMGRTRESIEVLKSARQRVDPTNPQIVKMTGHAYFVDRDFTNALAYYREAGRVNPRFANGHFFASRALIALNDYRAAIDEWEISDTILGKDPAQTKQKYKELRDAFDHSGPDGYWRKRLEQITATLDPADEPYAYAKICAYLRNKTDAFRYLDRAYARHDEFLYLIFDECWDSWREEPQFQALMAKVGLAEYERRWLRRLKTGVVAEHEAKNTPR